MTSRLPVTVVIPVRNEEKNLPDCLHALGDCFEEVIVVDSDSTDSTKKIALEHSTTWINFLWNGQFPKKRNWVLRNHLFRTPWVFFLDCDERVSAQLIEELRTELPTSVHNGYWITYRNFFMGHKLTYGDSLCKLALFRVGSGEYERFPENHWSALDMEIHEHPILLGTTGSLATKIDHMDYHGLHHYINKHNHYSTWEMHRYFFLLGAGPEEWRRLTNRQRFKYRFMNRWWLSHVYFMVSYLAQLGFLDGRVGWIFNRFKLRYFQDIRLKILEQQRNSKNAMQSERT